LNYADVGLGFVPLFPRGRIEMTMRALIGPGLATVALVTALGSSLVGCSAGSSSTNQAQRSESTGDAVLALQLASGEQIDTVAYTITGPGGFTTTGTIDVSGAATLSPVIGGIPAGTGYTIVLTANIGDGGINCAGTGTFDVIASSTTTVPVTLRCVRARTQGSVLINGSANECPTIDTYQAFPAKAAIGGQIPLTSTASDSDGPQPLSYLWTTTSGTLTNSTSPNATLTCTVTGKPTVTLTVSDGDPLPSCADKVSLDVVCVDCLGDGACDDHNVCTLTDTCHAETCVGSNPAPARTPCDPNKICDGAGACVECLLPSDCPGSDTACATRTCTAGKCGVAFAPAGPTAMQTPGDCKSNRCDGFGNLFVQNDDTDVPVDGNLCTADTCSMGVPSNPPLPVETPCGTSLVCDGAGACVPLTVSVARVGDGSAPLDPNATKVFIESRKIDGTLVGTPIPMPIAASGSNLPFTAAGTNIAEGTLSRSTDHHFLTMAGYGSVPGTLDPANNSGPRIVARINALGAIDTSTVMSAGAFVTQSIRTATSVDGTSFWVGGLGANDSFGQPTGGIWYISRGTTGGTQLSGSPIRVLGIFGGQLFGTGEASLRLEVFRAGSGLPTTGPLTVSGLPGMPTTAQSPGAFVFLDMSPTAGDASGLDVVYVAVSAPAASGVQKWTYNNATNLWVLAKTMNLASPVGFRGLAGFAAGTTVTLVGTTTESPLNRLVVFVDDGSPSTLGTAIATVPANEAFRGVALPPRP
jgi:hypothetical protein